MVDLALDPPTISEIIEIALSDHVSFDQLRALLGVGPDEAKALMRQNLKTGTHPGAKAEKHVYMDL